jgi:hypothetical protein
MKHTKGPWRRWGWIHYKLIHMDDKIHCTHHEDVPQPEPVLDSVNWHIEYDNLGNKIMVEGDISGHTHHGDATQPEFVPMTFEAVTQQEKDSLRM